ncbi:GAF domain-containing protein [Sphingomonas kaistensis]|uniref:histidine kinase n=1 Tax=Sphingomonas kaistensis TaxID=298708 RepID=A0ABZ2G0V1_9SPHN
MTPHRSDIAQAHALPWDEADRVAALDRYAILDTEREAAFDAVAELAADFLDAPMAVVNFIAADRQWFKAEVGIGTDSLPLDVSICRHAILQNDLLVVPDLTADPRFEANPLVNVAGGLRFYAGAVLRTPEGLPLGTVCVLDRTARPQGITERQRRGLKMLADQTMARLELNRSEALARAERARAEQRGERLSLLAKASTLLLAAGDKARAVDSLFSLIRVPFQLDVGFHYRCSDDGLHLIASVGLTPEQEVAAGRLEVGQTICGLVAESRDALHVTDIQSSGDPQVAFLQELQIDHYFSAPLIAGKTLLGTVSFGRRGTAFSQGELEVLRALSAQLSIAIERGLAEDALKASEERQAFLLALSDELRVLRTPVDIASAAAQRLGNRFGLSRVFYAEFHGSVMKIERDYTRGVGSLAGEHDLAVFGPDLLRAYHEDAVVKVDDVQTDPRFNADARAGLGARQVGAYLDVILFAETQWASVLALQSATPRNWTASEEALFRDVGERVRTAIDRVRAEDHLRRFNEKLEAQVEARVAERDRLWNLSPDLLARADYDGHMSAVSPAWKRVLGWSEQELLSRGYATFMHPDDMPATLQAIAGMGDSGRPARFENRIATSDGGWKSIEWTVAPEPDGINFIAVGRDLSDAKARDAELEAAQEALRQSQKMEAMGQLTGGVAHDFNNLLTPIVGSLDMLQRKGLGNEREQRLIAGAVQSADRAKTLVQRLLAFARRQPLQAVSVNLAPLVRGMADLIASTTGPQIKVVVDAADDLPPAKVDPNQLEMAILNLSVNARDAMQDGGTLRISVDWQELAARRRGIDLAPGRYLRVSVADTGDGMDAATLKRAVEPFFSTKGVGKGTGLGLSMVHGLASQLGGALAIHSTEGVGTNIELWLPQSVDPLVAAESTTEVAPSTNTGTVLLVDDEDLVRLSTADMLIELGYAVVEASSAEEALDLLHCGLKPDLLVTDHLMPGMTGTELVGLLRDQGMGIATLIVSGYAEAEGVASDLPRLTKPFRRADLAASLASLDAPVSGDR